MITGIPSKEELTYVRNSILLPFLLDVIESNKRKLLVQHDPLNALYIATTEALMNRISQDIKACKQALKKAEIKVWPTDDTPEALCYAFSCRGYQDSFSLSRNIAKAELSVLLTEYVKEMGKNLSQTTYKPHFN